MVHSRVRTTGNPRRGRSSCIWWLFLCLTIVWTICPCAHGLLLAMSRIERCGGSAHDPAGCTKKLVTQLLLDDVRAFGSGLKGSVNITQADDLTVFGEPGTALADLPPLSVSASIGSLRRLYSLIYRGDYAASYTEVPKESIPFDLCNSEDGRCDSRTPLDGNPVSRPSGLCCSCSECMKQNRIGAGTDALCRGRNFSEICLLPSRLKYAGYELKNSSLRYRASVTVRGVSFRPGTGGDSLEFELSNKFPSSTLGMRIPADGRTVRSWTSVAVTNVTTADGPYGRMAGHVLFTPSDYETARASAAEWLLLPAGLVRMDGEAAVAQGAPEGTPIAADWQPPEDCRDCYRLEDYRAADLGRRAGGSNTGRYLASSFGEFGIDPVGGVKHLVDWTNTSGSLRLTWTVCADGLNYSLAPSAGALDRVFTTQTAGENGGNASLTAVVRNVGGVGSRFFVDVANCTGSVRVVGAGRQAVALLASQGAVVSFALRAPVGLPQGDFACDVALHDSREALVSRRTAHWGMKPSDPTSPGSESGNNDGNTSSNAGTTISNNAVHAECSFFNLLCVFSRGRFWQVSAWVLIVLVVITAVYLIYRYRERLLNFCCRRESSGLAKESHSDELPFEKMQPGFAPVVHSVAQGEV